MNALSAFETPAVEQEDQRNAAANFSGVPRAAALTFASTDTLICASRGSLVESDPMRLRRSVSVDVLFARYSAGDTAGVFPRHRGLQLRFEEQQRLHQEYGADLVSARLRHDVFADVVALRRQLAHESKTEITCSDM